MHSVLTYQRSHLVFGLLIQQKELQACAQAERCREHADSHSNTSVSGDRDPLPSIDLQRKFTRVVEVVEKLNGVHRESLAKLDELFAAAQFDVFLPPSYGFLYRVILLISTIPPDRRSSAFALSAHHHAKAHNRHGQKHAVKAQFKAIITRRTGQLRKLIWLCQ